MLWESFHFLSLLLVIFVSEFCDYILVLFDNAGLNTWQEKHVSWKFIINHKILYMIYFLFLFYQ